MIVMSSHLRRLPKRLSPGSYHESAPDMLLSALQGFEQMCVGTTI